MTMENQVQEPDISKTEQDLQRDQTETDKSDLHTNSGKKVFRFNLNELKKAALFSKKFLSHTRHQGTGNSFTYILKRVISKENVRAILADRSKLALGMSMLALAAGVISMCSNNRQYIDPDNPFVKSNEIATMQGFNNLGNTSASTGLSAEDNDTALDPSLSRHEGIIFRDHEEFKAEVSKVMQELKLDEVREHISQIAARYNAAGETVPQSRKIYGNPQARFLMQEYSDTECPYCKNYASIPKDVADASNGQVALEWKDFPLAFHDPAATRQALGLQCIYKLGGNRAYWVGLERIFESTMSNGRGTAVFDNLARELGVDQAKWLECLNDPATAKSIEKDKKDALKYNISSTPTTVIIDTLTGRSEILTGAVPAEQLMQTIETMNQQAAVQAKR